MNLEQAREEWDNVTREVSFCEARPWGLNAYGDRDDWLFDAREYFKRRLPRHDYLYVLRRWVRVCGLHWVDCRAVGADGSMPLLIVGDSAETVTRAARAWRNVCKAERAEVAG